MNDNIIRGRSPRRPRLWWAGVLAAAALLAAGCGSPAGSQAAGSSPYQKALPFAQCMRSHGVPNYPDPLSNGNFGEISNSIQHSPQYDGAKQTCTRLHPWNMVLSSQQQTQEMTELLKYSRCMRAHGVPNFSDPTEHNGGISFGGQTNEGSAGSGQGSPGSGQGSAGSGKPGGGSGSPAAGQGGGSGAPSESPQYQAANQACQSYLRAAQAARAGGKP
jgi:hypothetical protein